MAGGKSTGAGRRSAGTVRRRTRWGTQVVRTQVQWCDEVEDAFLDRLAATCNVRVACEGAGVGHTSVYRQRRLRADFAVKWQAALEQGYARLEAALLRAAAEAMEGVAFDADVPVAPVSAETALALLRFHRASVTGEGRRSGWRAPAKPIEAVKAEILARIEAIARAEEGEVPGVYLAPLPTPGEGLVLQRRHALPSALRACPSRSGGRGQGSGGRGVDERHPRQHPAPFAGQAAVVAGGIVASGGGGAGGGLGELGA